MRETGMFAAETPAFPESGDGLGDQPDCAKDSHCPEDEEWPSHELRMVEK